MSDMDYGRGTWHVGDGALNVYSGGVAVIRLELSALQLVGLARDLSDEAHRILAKQSNNGA